MVDPQAFEDVVHKELNRFRGKLAGLIEAGGLPERQERGLVTSMKSLSYDVEAALIKLLQQ